MALSILKRPNGYLIGQTKVTGTYTNGSSTITKTGHGLSTANIIYISNNQATGFWYVTSLGADTFNIREYAGATAYSFVGSGNVDYYLCSSEHGWNAVHLPIVYKLSSNKWPTNSVDTVRTVSSYANDNGYIKITASGVLNANITEQEFVKIVFTGGEEVIAQVIAWYSTSIVTVNIPYTGGLTFVSVQYYYNNYHARIRVYAGLSASHTFAAENPYELITEQSVVPDTSGIVEINVNEFLKEKIAILSNDLLKGTLPNNIDAFCQFYITYAEAYDDGGGGYTLQDFVGDYTDDSGNFQGYASNSELPFKNRYSGVMSEYSANSETSLINKNFNTSTLTPFANVPPSVIPWFILGEAATNILTAGQITDELSAPATIVKGRFYIGHILYQTTGTLGNMRLFTSGTEIQTLPSTNNSRSLVKFMFKSEVNASSLSVKAYAGASAENFFIFHVVYSECNVFKFLTPSLYPRLCPGQFFDISFISQYDSSLVMMRELYLNGVLIDRFLDSVTMVDVGVYRHQVEQSYRGEDRIDLTLFFEDYPGLVQVTEKKTIEVGCDCGYNYLDLSWLNHLGGFDYWRFTGNSEFGVDVQSTTETKKNIFPDWPKSIGENADTIRHETSRVSNQTITLLAENLSADQVQDLFRIRTSTLVQIVNSRGDRRTVIPDRASFNYYKQGEKLYQLTFKVDFTNDLPNQSL